jgi:prepilin-type N-terminal cleavage/methylation domain-containing protein
MKNKGFTLIEMLVAIAVFSILLVSIMNTFTRGFYYQKRIIEMQTVEREETYLMETISREIRMAKGKPTVEGLNGSSVLTFEDHEGTLATYCLAEADGTCSSSPTAKSFSIKGQAVSSSDVEIMGLRFSTSTNFATSQPLVTITMQLRSKKDPGASAVLQTSVAMRLYPTI